MLVPAVIRGTGHPDTHLGKSLLVIVSQVKVIKRGKDCLVTPLSQQMLQLLTDGGFSRALRSAHPNKQRSVWMRLLMLLQLVVEPEIDRQVVLVDTSSANRHYSGWLQCAKVRAEPLLTAAGRWLCYQSGDPSARLVNLPAFASVRADQGHQWASLRMYWR